MIRFHGLGTRIYEARVAADSDPSAFAISWAIVPPDTAPEPADFVAGSWGSWNANESDILSYTPTIGGVGTGASIELPAGRYEVFAKVELGHSSPIDHVDSVEIVAIGR